MVDPKDLEHESREGYALVVREEDWYFEGLPRHPRYRTWSTPKLTQHLKSLVAHKRGLPRSAESIGKHCNYMKQELAVRRWLDYMRSHPDSTRPCPANLKKPKYLSARHEYIAAQHVAGKTREEIAEMMGLMPNQVLAALKRPAVIKRIEELRSELHKGIKVDAKEVADKFAELHELAKEHKDFTNANRSLENLGKHLGMFVEKTEQTVINKTATVEEVDKKLADLLEQVRGTPLPKAVGE